MSKGIMIREMLEDGETYTAIAKNLDVALSTIAYHARKIGKQQFTFERTIHNWAVIQIFYDDGHTIKEIENEFGADWSTVKAAAARGVFSLADRKCPVRKRRLQSTRAKSQRTLYVLPEAVLVEHSAHGNQTVIRILTTHHMLPYRCSDKHCPLHNPTWLGRKIVLHLDHINGTRDDHRLTNLRWLCPNCHSQTATYCGRNNRRRRERDSNSPLDF